MFSRWLSIRENVASTISQPLEIQGRAAQEECRTKSSRRSVLKRVPARVRPYAMAWRALTGRKLRRARTFAQCPPSMKGQQRANRRAQGRARCTVAQRDRHRPHPLDGSRAATVRECWVNRARDRKHAEKDNY